MPEDVMAALDRFQEFVGRFGMGAIIDPHSGFTVADAALLIGEVQLAASQHRGDHHDFDE